MINLNELKKLAEEASPGPWKYDYGNWQVEVKSTRHGVCDLNGGLSRDGIEEQNPVNPVFDGQFIAAANPQTILTLIDVIENMGEALDFYARDMNHPKGGAVLIENGYFKNADSGDTFFFGKRARETLAKVEEVLE